MISISKSRLGFSLVELLIVVALTGVVAVWGFSVLNKISRARGVEASRVEAASKLRVLVDDAKRMFQARAPGASFAAIASPAFSGLGATPCQGLRVTQFSSSINANVTTTYVTDCARFILPTGQWLISVDPKRFPVNPDLICNANEVPRVTVTRTVAIVPPEITVTQYPVQPQADWPGTSLCFRFQGTDISVEGGIIFASGAEVGQVAKKFVLSTVDRGAGIQYLSP